MKRLLLLLLLCLLGCWNAFAQDINPSVNASSCEKPAYPLPSKRLTEEGTVQLRFLVGVDGKVIESEVEKSSGFRRLDEAAKEGLSKCSFKPAVKDGLNVQRWASMKYTWRLELSAPCTGSDISKWRSCLGTLTTPMGGLSVVEYEAGKKSGRGIEYDATGNVIRAGIFEGEKLVSERILDTKLYPFDSKLAINETTLSASRLPTCQGSNPTYWNDCLGEESNIGGTKFSGEFKNGKRHGKGEYLWDNGDKFVGEYLDNKRNGVGIDYLASGLVKESGTFREGRLTVKHYVDPKLYPFSSPQSVSTVTISNTTERDRLEAEIESEKKKREELEEKLRVAQQQSAKPTASYGAERRVALVIGNATYKINPLKNPVNDSTDMARSLRSVGFDVIEANNTTLAQIREVTRRFADKLGSSDVGLVYYSGHGVEVKGKNYLIPVNADIKREYEVVDQAFDASQFLEMMDNIRGPNNKRVNILIVDACRNNELQKSWRSTNNGLARMDAPGGTFISFATAPGRVAADGVGRNSPYTKHLLQALKQPNVPIEQVFKVVRRNVMEETKGEQIPWENSSLVGDFYFTVQR